jgi:hypothetical protein
MEGSLDACGLVSSSLRSATEIEILDQKAPLLPSKSPCLLGLAFDLTKWKGPQSNPANLSTGCQQTVYELFVQIFCAAAATATDKEPVRYLSRYVRALAKTSNSSGGSYFGVPHYSFDTEHRLF